MQIRVLKTLDISYSHPASPLARRRPNPLLEPREALGLAHWKNEMSQYLRAEQPVPVAAGEHIAHPRPPEPCRGVPRRTVQPSSVVCKRKASDSLVRVRSSETQDISYFRSVTNSARVLPMRVAPCRRGVDSCATWANQPPDSRFREWLSRFAKPQVVPSITPRFPPEFEPAALRVAIRQNPKVHIGTLLGIL